MTNMKNEKAKSKPKLFKTNFYNPYDTKKRTRTTKEQLGALEAIFQCSPKPPLAVRRELSTKLEMPMRNVQVWFQNRRAKAKSTNTYPVPPEDIALNEAASFEAARMVKNIKSLTVTIPPVGMDANHLKVSHLVNHSNNYMNLNSPFHPNGMDLSIFSYPQTPWSAHQLNTPISFATHSNSMANPELVSFLRTSPTTDFPPQPNHLVTNHFVNLDLNARPSPMTCTNSTLTPFSAGLLTSPFHMNLEPNFLYTPATESFPFESDSFYHHSQTVPSYSNIN